MDKFKGFRTIAFNLVMGLGLVIGSEFDPALIDQALNGIVAAWMVGNVFLRAITTSRIFRKE